MKKPNFLEKILAAFTSSKIWLSVVFIVFGVSLVVYVFGIVIGTSALLLVQI